MQVDTNKFQKQMLTKFKITQILEPDRCAIAKTNWQSLGLLQNPNCKEYKAL